MANKIQGSVDTNVLLRLLLDDIHAQTKAAQSLIDSGDRYEVADAALIEVVFVLEKIYSMDRALIMENVLAIVRNRTFICNRVLFEQVMPQYVQEPSLSVVDCALLAYARLNKAVPLYTFDKKLIQKSGVDCQMPL